MTSSPHSGYWSHTYFDAHSPTPARPSYDSPKTDPQKAPQESPQKSIVIDVHPDEHYQTLIGFGAAFTEAGGYALSYLDAPDQEKVMAEYFGPEGSGYSLCRTHIQSCDFSLSNYAYVNHHKQVLHSGQRHDGDSPSGSPSDSPSGSTYGDVSDKDVAIDITRDTYYLIPMIQQAIAQLKHQGKDLRLVASPWSPPPFMKTTHTMNRGGTLLPQWREAWAKCIADYIVAYQQRGIDIWGLTVQNEPEAVQIWDSCEYSAIEEAEFIVDFLAPVLKTHALNPRLIVWDHNRDRLFERASQVYRHPKAAPLVWGAGFHWYEELSHGTAMHDEVARTHTAYPDKHLILTEAAQELIDRDVAHGDWVSAERYASNIIGDLNAWAEGWIDWNMILDSRGGPNHAGNYCDAGIKIDIQKKTWQKTPIYYAIKHFSAYILPDSVRVAHSYPQSDPQSDPQSNVQASERNPLKLTTWKSRDNLVIVAYNSSDQELQYELRIHETRIPSNIPARGIQTHNIALTTL